MKFPSFRKMKFFKKRDKRKDATPGNICAQPDLSFGSPSWPQFGGSSPLGQFQPTRASARALARLPDRVLGRIFALICPHSRDETYSSCEESGLSDACMLCDARDLAHCALVCRQWYEIAESVL